MFFEAGHILQPRYFASAPGIPKEGPDDNEGFSDPDGKYPETEVNAPHNPHSLNEPDFHRLGRNEGISDTIVQSKSNNKINGVPTADGNTWDEPAPYYSAQYPNNKVFASNSGITIEIDDTSGEERIHIYHPSSSYTEINKDGSMVIRNKLDKFQIVDGDNKILIQKNRTKTVYENEEEYTSKNKTEYVGGEKDETVDKDKSTQINANWSVSITGTTIIESDGTTTVNGSEVYLNNGSGRGPAGKIVTMNHICQVTGLPHNNGSSTCYAEF